MAEIEVDIPEPLDMQIDDLVDSGEFLTREEAIEELLVSGLQTYQTGLSLEEEEGDLAFADEMRNPGDRPMDPGEDAF